MDNHRADEEDGPPHSQVFCCYAPDLRPLATILSSVHFSARAVIQVSNTGFHVQVEIGKILIAHAFLERSAFIEWHFNPPVVSNSQKLHRSSDDDDPPSRREPNEEEEDEDLADVKFEISMTSLIECLNVFGTATSQKTFKKNFLDPEGLTDHQESTTSHMPGGHKRGPILAKAKSRKQPASAVRISYDGNGHPLVLLQHRRQRSNHKMLLGHV